MMGRPFVGALVVSLCLGLLAGAGLLYSSPPQAGRASQASTAIGIDADPKGNTDTSLGNINACVSVAPGKTFDVDIFVADIVDVVEWQATFIYDPSVLRVTEANPELWLASGEGGRVVNFSDLTPDQDGSYSFVIVNLTPSGEGYTGSGVLARVTLEAVAKGTSFLTLEGVVLGNSQSQPIDDVNGDHTFDGPMSDAQVWVGAPCPSSLPTRSPDTSPTVAQETPPATTATPSTPAITATPKPGQPTPMPATASPQPTSQATPSAGGDNGGFPWVVVVGAGAATIVALLAAALVFRWLLRRAA
jgi:hypothetical protein